MFAVSRQQSFFVQNRPFASLSAGASSPRLVRSLYALSLASVAVGSVFVAARVLFAEAPIGGPSGLLSFYASTALAGIGMAVLSQLKGALRATASSMAPPGTLVSIPRSSTATSAHNDMDFRPFDAA
jgi:hypothetical protein